MPDKNKTRGAVLTRMARLQKDFNKLYGNTPLVGVYSDSVVVKAEAIRWLKDHKWNVIPRADKDFPFEAKVVYEGATFQVFLTEAEHEEIFGS